MSTNPIELLSPAGSLKTMRYAFAYGADAVYAGAARYSLRMRGNEFNDEHLQTGIAEAHASGKKFYLTVNTMPHNYKLQTALRDLSPVLSAKPDACIMSDAGLIMLVREAFPDLPIHLSVQANSMNWASVQFWQNNGISRIILSRELSLDEIKEIRQRCPDIELEVFIHGALCIAYSGRCLLSGYFNNRDPNQGVCTNACRWRYQTHESREETAGDFVPVLEKPKSHAERTYFLEEENRRGEYMEISEDEQGTYILNSRDLRAIEHVRALVEIGVDCLKIEGRTKSFYYAARTAQIYRQAIDDALADKDFNPQLSRDLDGLANRGYTDGFFVRRNINAQQNYETGSSNAATQQFVGEIIDFDPVTGLATVEAKNYLQTGDKVALITPEGNRDLVLGTLFDVKTGEIVPAAKGSGWIVKTDLGAISSLALLAKYLA